MATMADMTDEPTNQLPQGFEALLLHDARTPEEREAAERKENARRKGRGRKDWWAKPPLPPD